MFCTLSLIIKIENRNDKDMLKANRPRCKPHFNTIININVIDQKEKLQSNSKF